MITVLLQFTQTPEHKREVNQESPATAPQYDFDFQGGADLRIATWVYEWHKQIE